MKPMTRAQIKALEDAGMPMPAGFTGIWKGQQYYKGKRWYGPTNLVGYRQTIVPFSRFFDAPPAPRVQP